MLYSKTLNQFLLAMALSAATLWLTACGGGPQQTDTEAEAIELPNITVSPLEGSPEFPEASLSLVSESAGDSAHNFEFAVAGYELGAQTDAPLELANSGKGQHIHFIVDNGPYSAHYDPAFATDKLAEPGNHVVLAFLSRSYHESVKNLADPASFVLTQIQTGEGEVEQADFSAPHLFYSRPKGTYKGADTENLLLDFFLLNADLAPDGYKVRATINGEKFLLTQWVPYVVEGLPKGEATFKLELLDAENNPVPGPFNVVERTVMLEE
ncbi:MAG: hypothetical protein AAF399_18740 [Bacteroidota bacterium]